MKYENIASYMATPCCVNTNTKGGKSYGGGLCIARLTSIVCHVSNHGGTWTLQGPGQMLFAIVCVYIYIHFTILPVCCLKFNKNILDINVDYTWEEKLPFPI